MEIRNNDILRGLRDGLYIGWDPFGTICTTMTGDYTIGGVGLINTPKRSGVKYYTSKAVGGLLGAGMNVASFGSIQAVCFIGDAYDFHADLWIKNITDYRRRQSDRII